MGGSNEFYDKFSVRYHLSVILRLLWENPEHRRTFLSESRLAKHTTLFLVLTNQITSFITLVTVVMTLLS